MEGSGFQRYGQTKPVFDYAAPSNIKARSILSLRRHWADGTRLSLTHTHTPNALCSQDNIGEKMDARNREMSRFQRENKFLEKRLLELQEELTESKRIGAPPPTVICLIRIRTNYRDFRLGDRPIPLT